MANKGQNEEEKYETDSRPTPVEEMEVGNFGYKIPKGDPDFETVKNGLKAAGCKWDKEKYIWMSKHRLPEFEKYLVGGEKPKKVTPVHRATKEEISKDTPSWMEDNKAPPIDDSEIPF